MPRLIDYAEVLETLTAGGLRCAYFNSGAFVPRKRTSIEGFIGPDDTTIRQEMLAHVTRVQPPYPQALAAQLTETWRTRYPGRVWVMPGSHWAYELDFGNADWLPAAVREIGVDPAELKLLNNASALAFDESEANTFEKFVATLLGNLKASDFTVAFPGQCAVATLHHHQQVWWQKGEEE